MSTLHLFNESPFAGNQFEQTLAFVSQKDAILLTGDAIYALLANTAPFELLKQSTFIIYALDEDIVTRAVQIGLDNVKIINYQQFVELCAQYSKVVSWL
ncbi:sulfurtransferase complex subunit TusB [Entomomonas asaccharolytica]|uniref:Sulfurtransferase complex subunit TusB n=1 Tax=Entomomonas asaccharolytica TaxID=2785331 RepID=A0A974NEM9_9GAMM|nr:sulfurtransferase complex subunit TusB [Entomomonas asaccharolytica]QQP85104.1 sulfurtransferase complex subunit TusB [Entomomonas asaccharolytica]